MLTLLEVVDDAVKIGLGAVIVLIGTLATNRHQRKREFQNRRLDIIQKATTDFQTSSQVFLRLFANYTTYRAPHNQVDIASGQKTWSAVDSIIASEVTPAFLSFLSSEATLVVVGAGNSSKKIEAFRLLAVELQNSCLPTMMGFPVVPTVEQIRIIWGKASDARNAVFESLRRDFYRS